MKVELHITLYLRASPCFQLPPYSSASRGFLYFDGNENFIEKPPLAGPGIHWIC
jgi:hypothetical protein